jgi:hypothetical protein
MNTKSPYYIPTNDGYIMLLLMGSHDSLVPKEILSYQKLQNHIPATFEWTSATDAGAIPPKLSDYVLQCVSYYMDDTDVMRLPFFYRVLTSHIGSHFWCIGDYIALHIWQHTNKDGLLTGCSPP